MVCETCLNASGSRDRVLGVKRSPTIQVFACHMKTQPITNHTQVPAGLSFPIIGFPFQSASQNCAVVSSMYSHPRIPTDCDRYRLRGSLINSKPDHHHSMYLSFTRTYIDSILLHKSLINHSPISSRARTKRYWIRTSKAWKCSANLEDP
jgi:hypothetical protein